MASAEAHSAVIRSAEHPGFARIVFEWDAPTRYEASIDARRLTVAFERPIDASIEGLVSRLGGDYLLAGSVAPDGRSVAFELAKDFALRSFPQSLMIVIDLVDPEPDAIAAAPAATVEAPSAGVAEPAFEAADAVIDTDARIETDAAIETNSDLGAKTTAAAADSAGRIPVRVGEHERFDRVVFDWPSAPGYSVADQGREVRIVFDAGAAIDLDALQRDLPARLTGVTARAEAGSLVVVFERIAAGTIHHFLSGSSVALDFIDDAALASLDEPPADPVAEIAAADPTPIAAADPTPIAAVEPVAAAISERVEAESDPGPAFAGADEAPTVEAATDTEVLAQAAGLADIAPEAAPTSTWTQRPDEMMAAAPPLPLVPAEELLPPIGYVAAPTIETVAPSGADMVTAGPAIPVRLSDIGAGLRFRFAWDESTGAAVYSRNGSLWVIFDAKREISLPPMGTPMIRKAGIVGGETLNLDHATVLRFDLEDEVFADVRRVGSDWLVDFVRRPNDPLRLLALRVEPDATGLARVVLPDASVGPVLRFTDPVAGDPLIVVPLYGSGHGVAPARNYAQFGMLPTAQGVVIQPYGEDVTVRGLRTGIEVSSARGLYISPLTVGAGMVDDSDEAASRVLRFDDWRSQDSLELTESRNTYLRAVAMADDATRPLARLDLARFYVANALYAEALGVLARIEEDTPDLAQSYDFAAVRGAAMLLAGRAESAARDLERPELDPVPEIGVWRAAVAAERGDWERAAELFEVADSGILRLPPAWQIEFSLLAATAAVEAGDVVRAHFRLDQIEKAKPSEIVMAEVDYLRGRAFALGANFDAALDLWEAVAQGSARPMRAAASLARIRLLQELDWITVPEAIDAYEQLRFAWRGDEFEQQLLEELGTLYLEENDYLAGLTAWRQAVRNFEDSPTTRAIAEETNEIFSQLYVEGKSEQLAPLDAVSVYFEFRELTPDGPVGDEIIGSLADRLVGVDLLNRAAALLEHQIDQRLTGAAKAAVGARLAQIHLMEGDPVSALAGLERSLDGSEVLPRAVAVERRHLEARALIALDRLDEATRRLVGDTSLAAEQMRADIHWRAQEWALAAAAAERVLATAGTNPVALSDSERYFVMLRAVSLVLSGNSRGLEGLNRRFGEIMAEGTYAEAFGLVTGNPEPGRMAFRDFAKTIADVSNIEAFLDGYRGGA